MASLASTRFASRDSTGRMRMLVLVAAIILVTGGLLSGVYRFAQNLKTEYRGTSEAGAFIAATLDHELDLRRQYLETLADEASELLSGRYTLNLDITRYLQPGPEKQGYQLARLPGFGPADQGLLTGSGAIPQTGSPEAHEMSMAMGLTPMFRALKRRDVHLPWVYYRSENDFVYVYPPPETPDGEARFYHVQDLAARTYAHAGPAANPTRTTVWSAVYDDAVGKGKIVTVSKPLYDHGRFMGVLNVDLALQTLVNTLKVRHIRHATESLVGKESGINLLQPDSAVLPASILAAPRGQPVGSGDTRYLVYPLKSANWSLVLEVDHRAMLWQAFRATLLLVGAIIASLACVVLLLLLVRAMRDMQEMSIRDGLTGLFNRRHFDEIAQREVAHSQRNGQWLGMAILDIDHFKKYNDFYGHQGGDDALQQVAGALRNAVRRATDGVFRVGGEEFAVLVQLNDPQHLASLMAQICEAVRVLVIPHEKSSWGKVTISLGATLIGPDNPLPLDTAYREADEALYEAKTAGRNRYMLSPAAARYAPALEPGEGTQHE
ncbi:sensor domain-containing diguanylate cyclase [Silvimonas iriomotensis]|uniref:diguanylate cyclase n=1 Tax=Silvimonas iriomotensis TaxID=449662 RepID=A0ABQ2PAS0_9NEIS|nr:sensor domain-containing diguanylate cyclase [Silvimonas iriomotensis]GGP22383.1 sensor domain-containing diguanylate cyclase [Silvimonas iriomotensis]